MLKKILCALLAGVILMGSVACANNSDTSNDTNDTAATAEGTDTEDRPELPEKNYGGDQFNILAKESSYGKLVSEKTNGEILNDAILEANMSVSQQFNVRFNHLKGDEKTMETLILAGDDEYDVAYNHDCSTATLSLNGWFYNIYDLPYIDPTESWWPQFITESFTLNEKMYYFSNYSSYSAMADTRVCFFNRQILRDHNMDVPYDSVRAGTWTLDQLTAMSTSIYTDLNGDGKRDEGDLFGFASTHYPYAWLEGFGIEFYKKEAPNSAVLTLNTEDERCYTLIEKLHNWFHGGNDGVWVNVYGAETVSLTMFAEKRAAFTFAGVGRQALMAIEGNVDYGIVPFPKIEASQATYFGGCTDELFSVPITVRDTERVGIILEAMAYAGYKYIRPAYCEDTLKTRFATDPDCAEMMNIIFDNQVISFAYLFALSMSGGNLQFGFIAETVEQNNVASVLKRKGKMERKFVQTISDFYS